MNKIYLDEYGTAHDAEVYTALNGDTLYIKDDYILEYTLLKLTNMGFDLDLRITERESGSPRHEYD